jgi:hypothetical protein
MTEGDRRSCEAMARTHRALTGAPLVVPRSLYDQLVAGGVDTANVMAAAPMPRRLDQ